MRLTVVSSRRVHLTPTGYAVEPLFGTYIEGYLKGFDQVVVCAPVLDRRNVEPSHTHTHLWNPAQVQVVHLPVSGGKLACYLRTLWILLDSAVAWEAALLFLPSWVGVLGYLAGWLRGRLTETCAYVAGDWGEVYRQDGAGKGRIRQWVAGTRAWVVDALTHTVVRGVSLTLVAGHGLFEKLSPVSPSTVRKAHPVFNLTWASINRREDTCKNQVIRCLFVGLLVDNKGLQYLIPALAQLRHEGEKLELTVVGDGPQRQKYENLAAENGMADACRFVGYVPHGDGLFGYYREADLFVLPSLTEGFPRVIYEAMGHGVPVVATAVGGIPAEVKHGSNGLLVDPRSVSELTVAIRTLMHDRQLRKTIIDNGYSSAGPVWSRSPSDDLHGWLGRDGGVVID